jgi:rhamnose transport system permease protein
MTTSTLLRPDPSSARPYPAYSRPVWWRLLMTRETAVIALLVAVFAYSTGNVENFDGPLTLYYLFLDMAPILLIALPMTLIIVTGEIDLSVASVVGLSSVLVGILHQDAGLSIPVAGVLAVLAGAAAGAVNGFLVAYVGLPSLAVTIGTLALYRGLSVGLLGTTAVTDFPERWTDLAKARIVDESSYPVILFPFLVLLVVFALLLHFSCFGRGVFEIGLNAEAAHFSGVRIERTKMVLFVLSGAVAAFAGIYYTLRYGSARGDNATGLELQVIAAVLLGGVSIFGGRGALHGVVAGVLLIGVLSSAMRLEGYTVNVINIVIGVLLVLSVISTSFLSWVSGLTSGRGGGPLAQLGLRRRRQAVADSSSTTEREKHP